MSRTYCHTHSKYDCPTCADEILSLGIQADKDRIAALESEVARLEACAARIVPEGFVMVPVEPTESMLRAMVDGFIAVNGDNNSEFLRGYARMLSAAPEGKK